eukprot:scaffold253387_cov20-Prasinocladus_malaysianus.AAC.1
MKTADPRPEIGPVRIKEDTLDESARLQGPLTEGFVRERKGEVLDLLSKHGAVVISGAVKDVEDRMARHRESGKEQVLRETTGNGASASDRRSSYSDVSGYEDVEDLLLDMLSSIWEGGESQKPLPRKSIHLKYGEGSENWAHQDNNHCKICPFQVQSTGNLVCVSKFTMSA